MMKRAIGLSETLGHIVAEVNGCDSNATRPKKEKRPTVVGRP
jgi:hypothetical protein